MIRWLWISQILNVTASPHGWVAWTIYRLPHLPLLRRRTLRIQRYLRPLYLHPQNRVLLLHMMNRKVILMNFTIWTLFLISESLTYCSKNATDHSFHLHSRFCFFTGSKGVSGVPRSHSTSSVEEFFAHVGHAVPEIPFLDH